MWPCQFLTIYLVDRPANHDVGFLAVSLCQKWDPICTLVMNIFLFRGGHHMMSIETNMKWNSFLRESKRRK